MAHDNIRALLNRGVPYEQAVHMVENLTITSSDSSGETNDAVVNEMKAGLNAVVS